MSVAAALRTQFEAIRGQLLARDAARLSRILANGGKTFDVARFERDAQQALLAAENRARLRPQQILYPPELPVTQAKEILAEAILAHQVVVVCGETGSGKTTQLPKLCLELGRGSRGLIGHTQPRRLAARSVATRIASELDTRLGELVGYETRFDRRVSERSLIKLMTDGILLAELQRDRELLAYDTIIIDEAHERSLNIDFLLGWLKRLLPRRPDLKLIITSATLDPERLAKHFGNTITTVIPAQTGIRNTGIGAQDLDSRLRGNDETVAVPILTVEGRGYPIETRYRTPLKDEDLEDQVGAAIEDLWRGGRVGDTLVFLPGEREIRDLAHSLPGRFPRAEVLSLYSRLPATQQDRVFSRGSAPRIVLSTNVAETSVTVPGIRYVVDSGTARINRYAPRLGVQQLQIEPIAQSAANQRAGRCGRVGPGTCVRLYEEDDFAARPLFTTPEILRSNLAGVILQMAALRLGDIDDFPWVDAPENRHVSEGYRLLQTLGALDDERQLTPLGRELARLPLDPRIARIVVAGRGTPCDEQMRVLAAALSVQDPHEVPPDAQEAARARHAEWRHPRSDFLTLLNLWTRWQQWSDSASNRQLRRLCREHYVSYLRLEEWESVYKQIGDLLTTKSPFPPAGEGGAQRRERAVSRSGKPSLPAPLPQAGEGSAAAQLETLYPQIHKCLAAGLIDHIGLKLPAEKGERPEFQGPRGRRFRVFPGSVLAKKPPPWMLSAQLAQTSQLFARINAEVQPEWLAEVGSHLVKRTLTNPVWNGERGEVTAIEHQSLFGLPLVRRARHFGSMEPVEARRIFIVEALVRGDWPAKPDFLKRNLALVAEVQDKEARLRRPDLLADEDSLFAFYDARVPAEVCTTAGLKTWLRAQGGKDPGAALRMDESDVLRPGANADVKHLFPDHMEIAGLSLRLSYTHDPGEDADGVSFHIPLSQLYALPPQPFDWLVPGLRPARIEALIRSLPMHLRRLCTPAAEYASALANRMEPKEGEFLPAICAHFNAMTGVKLEPGDFDVSKLPNHLRPRLVLEDAAGKAVAEAESLITLQQRNAEPARAALTQTAARDESARRWVREAVSDWDFGDPPDYVQLANGARGYPALETRADGLALKLFESPDAAARAHGLGVRSLLLAKLPDRLRDLVKTAKSKLGLALVGAPYTPEVLARAVAERAAERAWDLGAIRTESQFKAAVMQRGEFGRDAARRLDDVCQWLLTAADLKRRLRALGNRWPESSADLDQQLGSLFAAGFVTAISEAQWPRLPIYLKAIAIRLDRLPMKPARDLELTQQIGKAVKRQPTIAEPVRWMLEEWRVALFAQELKAVGAPNADKLAALLKA